MSITLRLLASLPSLLIGAAFLLPRLFSRGDMLLGTHVSPEFAASPEAARLKRRYALGVILIALCGAGLTLPGVTGALPLAYFLAGLSETVALLGLWLWTWRSLRPHRAPQAAATRSAVLVGPQSSHSATAALLALLPLALAALLLRVRWPTIPARFPTHWGIDGRANAWTDRSALAVAAPLLIGLAIVMLLFAMREAILRRSPGFTGRAAMLAVTRNALTGAAWLVSLLLSTVALLPLLRNPTVLIIATAAGSFCGGIALVVYVAYQAIGMPDTVVAAQKSTADRFWHGGILYSNSADHALFVPKRDGFGYTINFARPSAWLLLALLLAVPLMVPLLLHVLSR